MVRRYRTLQHAAAARRYWQRRFADEEAERKEREMSEAVLCPPHQGWRLIARRQFKTSTRLYRVGSTVDVADISTSNYRAFFSTHAGVPFVEWRPPSNTPSVVQPVDIGPQEPIKPRPKIELILGDDPLDSWRKTKARMIELCDGNAGLAEDILMADRTARELYRDAVRVGTNQVAQKRGVVSVGPNEVAGL